MVCRPALRSPPAAPRALPHPRPQPAQVCASPEGVPRHRKLGRRGGRIVNVTSRRDCGVESLTADLVRTTRKSFRQAPVSLAAASAGISARHQWPDQHVAQIRCGGAHETGPASFTPRHRAPRVIAVRVRGWAEGMRPMPSAAKFGAACGALPRHGPRPATGHPVCGGWIGHVRRGERWPPRFALQPSLSLPHKGKSGYLASFGAQS